MCIVHGSKASGVMDPDPDIAGDDDDAHGIDGLPGALGAARPRAARQPRAAGPLCIFVIVAAAAGLWHDLYRDSAGGSTQAVGLILSRWAWASASDEGCSEHELTLRGHLHRSSQARSLFGYIVYPVIETFEFAHAVPVDSLALPQIMLAIRDLPGNIHLGGDRNPIGSIAKDVLEDWRPPLMSKMQRLPTIITQGLLQAMLVVVRMWCQVLSGQTASWAPSFVPLLADTMTIGTTTPDCS